MIELILGILIGTIFLGSKTTNIIIPPKEEKMPLKKIKKMSKTEYERFINTPMTFILPPRDNIF